MNNHTKKGRNSNIEIARIISMFLIVLGHFSWQTKWNFQGVSLIRKASIQYMWFGGKLGVDIFVLITAYFICRRTFVSYNSIKKLWLQVLYYSIVLSLVGALIFQIPFGIKDILRTLFPVATGAYWFVTAYVVMMLLSPFINMMLATLTKKQYHQLLITLFAIFCVASLTQAESIGFNLDEGATIIGLYPFGAYLRLYQDDLRKLSRRQLVAGIILPLFLLFASGIAIDFVSQIAPGSFGMAHSFARFFGSVSPLQLIPALSIIELCVVSKPRDSWIINKVASAVFGVYLLHCHPLLISFIWDEVVDGNQFVHSGFVFIYGIGVSLVIFVIGILFDFIRQFLFEVIKLLFSKQPTIG